MSNTQYHKMIIKSGWLKKHRGTGIFKSWPLRWCILNGDCLFYFAKEADINCMGAICLPDNYTLVEHPYKPEEPDKFVFEILPGKAQSKASTNHDSHLFCASTNAERQEWMTAIRRIMYSSKGGAIFGQRIEETMAYEKKRGSNIPCVVSRCVEFILEHGMEAEGILRLAGRSSLLRELKDIFDTGQSINFDIALHDIHTVASLLKTYFRELPESIIPCNMYQTFMNCALRYQEAESYSEVETLKALAEKLPPDNYTILAYICQFLFRLSEKSDVNKMTSSNLALVFGPNLIRHLDLDNNPAIFMATADLTQVLTEMMISNSEYLFPEQIRKTHVIVNGDGVDEMLRLSAHLGYEILEPVNSVTSSTDLKDNAARKSMSLPREAEDSSESYAKRRHGKLNLDIVGSPMDGSAQPVPLTAPVDKPVPPIRRVRSKRERSFDHSEPQSNDEPSPLDRTDPPAFLPSDSVLLRSNLRRKPSSELADFVHVGQDEVKYTSTVTEEKYPTEHGCIDVQMEALTASGCTEAQLEVLKMNLLNQENEYRVRIKELEQKYASQIRDLVVKINEERESKAQAIKKVVLLQTELTRYQIKYGELPSS